MTCFWICHWLSYFCFGHTIFEVSFKRHEWKVHERNDYTCDMCNKILRRTGWHETYIFKFIQIDKAPSCLPKQLKQLQTSCFFMGQNHRSVLIVKKALFWSMDWKNLCFSVHIPQDLWNLAKGFECECSWIVTNVWFMSSSSTKYQRWIRHDLDENHYQDS